METKKVEVNGKALNGKSANGVSKYDDDVVVIGRHVPPLFSLNFVFIIIILMLVIFSSFTPPVSLIIIV